MDGETKAIVEQFKKYHRYDFSMNDAKSIFETLTTIVQDNVLYDPVPDFSKEMVANSIVKWWGKSHC